MVDVSAGAAKRYHSNEPMTDAQRRYPRVAVQAGFHGGVIAAALTATAIGAVGYGTVQDALLVVLTVFVTSWALTLAKSRLLPRTAAIFGSSLPFLIILSIMASARVTGNHLYALFLVSIAISIALGTPLRAGWLMRMTNVYYLVYLAMSLAVYFGVIDLGRTLNIFDSARRAPWLSFPTLVGFYGSTAHIDSVSLFVGLVNLLFGRGRSRLLMVAIALAACLASVRFTPFVSLGIAILATALVLTVKRARSVRRTLSVAVALAMVLSAPLTIAFTQLVPSSRVEGFINSATNGRLRIWQSMGETFAASPPLTKLFGSGSTEPYYEVGGWPRVHPVTKQVEPLWTTNPHNSYLAVALNLGLLVFVLLALALGSVVSRMQTWRSLLVTYYLLSVGITNAELFTFLFPVYVVWVGWLCRPRSATLSTTPFGNLAARREPVP